MELYGYARVLTSDQDFTLQEQALRAAGCDVVRAEKVTGSTRTGRTALQLLLDFLRRGDTLVVTRFARSIKDLQDIVYILKERGVTLKATEQPIDTRSAAGKAFLDMLGVFAKFETNLRRERQLEGIAAAKARGVYRGRKPSVDPAEVQRLRVEEKLGATEIARGASVYRALVAALKLRTTNKNGRHLSNRRALELLEEWGRNAPRVGQGTQGAVLPANREPLPVTLATRSATLAT